MTASQPSVDGAVPILLLKTRSSPGDSYEDLLGSTNEDGWSFEPTFVPVLQHTLIQEGLDEVRTLLQNRGIRSDEGASYGGLIFTSQRAVEAFIGLVEQGKSSGADDDAAWPHLHLLRGLGLLDDASGRARPAEARDGRTYVATIGPTTRDYLRRTFGFEPDVCAATPSPEGVRRAIVDFTTSHSGSK
ncbi:Retrovirus-related Pol polyprotein from transposon TNT 1-94 [Verticillium dahliae VDG2]|nr:Retrovirus-related Pol polyprotein from transposon TNT 1-94 [Verticillium dahliae VDG2]